jgi:hypothetical protein
MSSTRSVKSPGVWGADASTSIPPSPLAGVAYRNTALTTGQTRGGWAFDTLVDSAKFNETLFRYGSLLDILDKQGVLGWSDQVDYAVPALVWGSDGALYRCLLASGPGSTVRDPVSAPAGYWELVTPAGASVSKTANGWAKMHGGLIVQWGYTMIPAQTVVTVSLPLAFPTAGLAGYASKHDPVINSAQYRWDCGMPTLTTITIANNWTSAIGGSWLAIGH